MSIFSFDDNDALGAVVSANQTLVTVGIHDAKRLTRLQVNQLTVLHSSKPGRYLIGQVVEVAQASRSTRKPLGREYNNRIQGNKLNLTTIELIGTFYNRINDDEDIFRRTLEIVPEIGASCFAIEGITLVDFMENISVGSDRDSKISLGRFKLHDNSIAYVNGNKIFQTHTMIVGSTGSGKSWTAARLLEQMAQMPSANAILLDIHGEYRTLGESKGFRKFKIADSIDSKNNLGLMDGVLYLPYWLLEYEELISLLGISSMRVSSNQEAAIRQAITIAKRATLSSEDYIDIDELGNIDAPVPFRFSDVIEYLENRDTELVDGAVKNTKRKGPYHGSLTLLIDRIRSALADDRFSFFFSPPDECHSMQWFSELVHHLLSSDSSDRYAKGGIRIIDLSGVSSNLLTLVTNLIAHILLYSNMNAEEDKRPPISIFCDEANFYMSESSFTRRSVYTIADDIFERIAKEGRKYGVSLVVVCQRPSEINHTVRSQCNNLILMRLLDVRDQNSIRGFFPRRLESIGDLLPKLDVGEALVLGDACQLQTPMQISAPQIRPTGETTAFWSKWKMESSNFDAEDVVRSWCIRNLE